MQKSTYESPFSTRYASEEMQALFSEDMKFRTWRFLWIILAESQKELGLPISQEQIDELKKYQNDINYEYAQKVEKQVKHDVTCSCLWSSMSDAKGSSILVQHPLCL